MKSLDSQALDNLNKALGLSGGAGAQRQVLDDGVVSLVLDVAKVARRRELVAGSANLFWIFIRNIHTGVSSLQTSFNPFFSPGLTYNGFPASLPEGWEIALLPPTVRASVEANFGAALLHYEGLATFQAIGKNNSSAAVAIADSMPLIGWTDAASQGGEIIALPQVGWPLNNRPFRLRRNPSPTASTGLAFSSSSITGAVNIDLYLPFVVAPVTLLDAL